MIKAIIFDLNGIFIQSPKLSERFEKDFNISLAEFVPVLSRIMNATRQRNAGPSFQYWQPELAKWKINLTEKEFWDYWFKAETVSERMVQFARKLRQKGIEVYLLSNNFNERADYYGHYPWMSEAVDKAYFSWQSGYVKPNPKAWLQILSENNLNPEECLYFDDQEKNVKVAEGIGISSYIFTNEEELEEEVNEQIKG